MVSAILNESQKSCWKTNPLGRTFTQPAFPAKQSTQYMSQPVALSLPGTDEDALAKRRRLAGAALPTALCMCNCMVLHGALLQAVVVVVTTCLQHARTWPMLCRCCACLFARQSYRVAFCLKRCLLGLPGFGPVAL